MPRGNPSPKLAITVDPDVPAKILASAAKEGVSASAWMTEAARDALKIRAGLEGVAEYEKEYGAFTKEELSQAGREVRGGTPDPAKLATPGLNRAVWDAGVLVAVVAQLSSTGCSGGLFARVSHWGWREREEPEARRGGEACGGDGGGDGEERAW